MPTWRYLDDAAQQAGISRRTVNRLIASGRLKVYRVPGDRRRMVDMDELEKVRQPTEVERPPQPPSANGGSSPG